MQMPAPIYEYKPLISDGSTFRIVTILPGKDDERIECSFLVVPISSIPKYSALSYTWGDTVITDYVWIHDRVIGIRDNLKDALKHLRDPERLCHFWIDALCINQEDETGEKTTQIPLMRHIYRNSYQVSIYLGREDDGSGEIPSLLDRIDYAYERSEMAGSDTTFTRNSLAPSRFEELGLPHTRATIWEAFRLLLSRDWFTRIWVIQEVILSTSAKVICGRWSLNWKRFLSTTFKAIALGVGLSADKVKAGSYSTKSGNPLISVTQLIFFNTLKPGDSEFVPWKLIDLLHHSRMSLATRPKDYCYGLLGLSRELGDPNLKLDYWLPVEAVYRQFARHFITQGDGVKVLYNACGHRLNLPSWVPDWSHRHLSRPRIVPVPVLQKTPITKPAVAAASSFTSFIRLNPTNSDILIIRGLIFDKIANLGDFYQSPNMHTRNKTWKAVENLKEVNSTNYNAPIPDFKDRENDLRIIFLIADCITELYQLLHSGQVLQYPTGEDDETVVWRTMICNYARCSTRKAPPTYVELYRSLLWLIKAHDPKWLIPHSPYLDSLLVEDIVTQNPLELLANANIMIQQMRGLCFSKRRGRTGRGYVGQFCVDAQFGDYIYIPLGSAVPYLIRPGSNNKYKLIGECYVHGIMEGEAFDILEDSINDLEFE
jgi:heterokaryon incompatibility protein (HET)